MISKDKLLAWLEEHTINVEQSMLYKAIKSGKFDADKEDENERLPPETNDSHR